MPSATMTSRERLLAAMEYRTPDRIPVYHHPSEAGLHVHGQKLLDLFNQYPADNIVSFMTIPQPPADAVDAKGEYYECYTDEWGATLEHRIFKLQGRLLKPPFETWERARDYTFPLVPAPGTAAFAELQQKVASNRSEKLIIEGWVSLFMKLYEIQHMETVLVDVFQEDPDLLAFVDRLTDFWEENIAALLEAGVDVVMFADDWITQSSQLVPTDTFRRHFLPRYRRLMEPIKKAGRKIWFHICGCHTDIIDDLLDLGIDAIWPQIALYDLDAFSKVCKSKGIMTFLHLDRQQLIPRGTPREIEEAVARYADHFHRLGGGAMFWIEIENDAPWENVEALIKAVHRYR